MPSKKKVTRKSSHKSKQPVQQSSSYGTCFTIMPFGNWFDYYYETIYVAAIKATNLIPRRADDLYRPRAIVNDIWILTQEAKVILAALSGKNPNVFHELGLAHALTKPAILVTESMEDVPFDLRSLRVIVYDKNKPDWGEVLRGKIETAIKEILASPLDAVLPTSLKVKESATRKSVTREEKELISIKQDMDLLKHQIQMLSSSPSRISKEPIITHFDQAVQFAKKYYFDGFPTNEIVRRLVEVSDLDRANAYRALKKALKEIVEAQTTNEITNEEDGNST